MSHQPAEDRRPDPGEKLPAPRLPERAWFEYGGKRLELRRYVNCDGYTVQCPKCGHSSSLESDALPGGSHQLTIRVDGALTAQPSLVCPHDGCTWHVWVRDGVATDAG